MLRLDRWMFVFLLVCVSSAGLAAESPEKAEPVVKRDIAYTQPVDETTEGTSHLCDVYLPAKSNPTAEASETLTPVVLVIHGGAWRAGAKWQMGAFCRGFAERGMAAVAINYRHAPKYPFPAQIDDVRAALVWIAEHGDEYGWDTNRIGIFGYSAGAHMACMVGTLIDEPQQTRQTTSDWTSDDPRWKKLPKISAIVAGGAPCEFRTMPEDNTALAYFLGGSRADQPQSYKAASPAAHASAGDVPTLFIHGSRDVIVPIGSAQALFDQQQTAGVASKFRTIEGQGHIMTFIHDETAPAVYAFLSERLK